MRKIKAQSIRDSVVRFCKAKGVKFSNVLYRRAKAEYTRTPWKEKANFAM